jgi:hypothetical protein
MNARSQITKQEPREPKKGVSAIFDLVVEGKPTVVARDKDKMIGDAVWEEYLEETGQKAKTRRK